MTLAKGVEGGELGSVVGRSFTAMRFTLYHLITTATLAYDCSSMLHFVCTCTRGYL